MKRHSNPYARKLRQFRYHAKQLKRLLANGEFARMAEARQQQIVQRLRRLYADLAGVISGTRLRRALAGLALALAAGAATPALGQTFGSPVVDPFNIDAVNDWSIPTLADIDNDGDLDLFVTGYNYSAGEYY
ncbi:MAG: VCBS repeat-containing protein, partial [Saprospiraceae bacterium]|nr:VCBS repeat-containing protein [Saprospiraceae bacterium]